MSGLRARRAVPWLAALLLAMAGAPVHGARLPAPLDSMTLDARAKYFGALSLLPEQDLQRRISGTPAYDDNLDLRLMLQGTAGPLSWQADLSTTLVRGDSLTLPAFDTPLDQTALNDRRRALDLAWELDSGPNHTLVQRFDRLSLRYRRGPWRVTAGRQAVTWGNGLVFQPLDLFNPFAPTTVDQDYKTGDDLLHVERSLAAGGSVQALAVLRRDAEGERSTDAGSYAAKWHRFVGRGELELVAARHYRDDVFGAALRFPVGGALIRADLAATRLDMDGGWSVSGIVNADYSLLAGGRNVYLFAEYFHNDFGVADLPADPQAYPEALTVRLGRGELFNLMRDYLALGGSLEWHPLWTQSATFIGNLHDGSVLLQMQVSHEPGDHQRFEVGVVAPLGGVGDEFGGVPAGAPAGSTTLTVGGGTRLYLRWGYYF